MDILRIIENDHEKVLDILSEIKESTAGTANARQQHIKKLKAELLPHMNAEEELFYPFLLEVGEDKDSVFEAIETHKVIKNLFKDIEGTNPDDERWLGKCKVLSDILDHHIEEEQDVLFEEAQDVMDENKSEEMGEKFEAAKEEAKQGIT